MPDEGSGIPKSAWGDTGEVGRIPGEMKFYIIIEKDDEADMLPSVPTFQAAFLKERALKTL